MYTNRVYSLAILSSLIVSIQVAYSLDPSLPLAERIKASVGETAISSQCADLCSPFLIGVTRLNSNTPPTKDEMSGFARLASQSPYRTDKGVANFAGYKVQKAGEGFTVNPITNCNPDDFFYEKTSPSKKIKVALTRFFYKRKLNKDANLNSTAFVADYNASIEQMKQRGCKATSDMFEKAVTTEVSYTNAFTPNTGEKKCGDYFFKAFSEFERSVRSNLPKECLIEWPVRERKKDATRCPDCTTPWSVYQTNLKGLQDCQGASESLAIQNTAIRKKLPDATAGVPTSEDNKTPVAEDLTSPMRRLAILRALGGNDLSALDKQTLLIQYATKTGEQLKACTNLRTNRDQENKLLTQKLSDFGDPSDETPTTNSTIPTPSLPVKPQGPGTVKPVKG